MTRQERAAVPATAPTAARDGGVRGSPERHSRGDPARRPQGAQRDPVAAGGRHRVDAGRLLGAEPRRETAGRRRDWQNVRAALERLADRHDRHRHDRHRPQERAGRLRTHDLGRQERDDR